MKNITVSGLDHIGVRVHEFIRSVGFYKQFGFKVIRDDRHERVIVMRHAAGVELNLLDSADCPETGSNILMDKPVRYPGYTHIALQVTDINATLQDIEAADIKVTEGPVTFGDGKTSVFIRDPDRNVIELTQLPVDKGMLNDRGAES